MDRRNFLITLMAAFTFPRSAFAQDAAEALAIPVYTPQIGQRISWKIELESAQKRAGMTDEPFSVQKAEFVQHMTVLGRTLDGYSVLWELEEPTGDTFAEQLYKGTLELYGVKQIAVGTDLAGMPKQVFGVEALRERVEDNINALDPQARSQATMLQYMLEAARENPLIELQALALAALLIGRGQRAGAWQAVPGESIVLPQSDQAWGAVISGDVAVKTESIDKVARTATLSWSWEFPLQSLTPTMRQRIAETLAKNSEMAGALPGPLREQATSSQHRYEGRAVVSAEDGAIIETQEIRTLRIGTDTFLTVLRVRRA